MKHHCALTTAALCLTLVTDLVACRPAPGASTPSRHGDCPDEPDTLDLSAVTKQLSRHARETRANFMQVASTTGQQPVIAVLYHEQLAAILAALDDPKAAQSLAPAWARQSMLSPFVELRIPRTSSLTPSAVLQARLTVDGQQVPILYLVKREDPSAEQVIYRMRLGRPLAPSAAVDSSRRASVRLGVPGPEGDLLFNWLISLRNSRILDSLPTMFRLARLRELLLARQELIMGAVNLARRRVEGVLRCSPAYEPALALQSVLAATPRPEPQPEVLALSHGASALAQAFAMRAALYSLFVAAAQHGLATVSTVRASAAALKQAARSSTPAQAAAALVHWDKRFAALLDQATSPDTPISRQGSKIRPLRFKGSSTHKTDAERRLSDLLVHAHAGLQPRWIVTDITRQKRPSPTRSPSAACQVLASRCGHPPCRETLLGITCLRLQEGWLHLGLPSGLNFEILGPLRQPKPKTTPNTAMEPLSPPNMSP